MKKFTLIEVLVVVAIIFILLAMLIPCIIDNKSEDAIIVTKVNKTYTELYEGTTEHYIVTTNGIFRCYLDEFAKVDVGKTYKLTTYKAWSKHPVVRTVEEIPSKIKAEAE